VIVGIGVALVKVKQAPCYWRAEPARSSAESVQLGFLFQAADTGVRSPRHVPVGERGPVALSVIEGTGDESLAMSRVVGDIGSEMTDAVIEVSGLRMSYDGFEAVRGVDLRVSRGEIFTFLGPNGAGKTTTVEILEGHRKRTAGEVRVLGEDPERADRWWRSRVGVVLQSSRVEPQLTVRECLELYAGYYPAPRSVQEVIELVGLKKRSNARCGNLSGGQQRRVDVALALIGDPELVFLDEPTTGFDPSARRSAWEMIDGLRQLGKTIFLTTHYMDEAEALADRIAVLSAGVIVAEGTPATLGGRDRAAYQITFTLPRGVAIGELPAESGSARPLDQAAKVLIESEQVMPTLQALSSWAIEHRHEISDLLVRRPALEDVYLGLTEPPK
jgi:ABC-2 type transport system ATP-binding protein